MECKWKDCNRPARAKSPFCSGTCKKRYQRASGTDVSVEVGQEQVGQATGTVSIGNIPITRCACLMDYQLNPCDYITRNQPELLNWGVWMNAGELDEAGLKANRVPIPGDWDYQKRDKPDVQDMTADELMRRLHYIRDWKRSPEHTEIMRRLNTYTVEQLEAQGQYVPGWKRKQEAAV